MRPSVHILQSCCPSVGFTSCAIFRHHLSFEMVKGWKASVMIGRDARVYEQLPQGNDVLCPWPLGTRRPTSNDAWRTIGRWLIILFVLDRCVRWKAGWHVCWKYNQPCGCIRTTSAASDKIKSRSFREHFVAQIPTNVTIRSGKIQRRSDRGHFLA